MKNIKFYFLFTALTTFLIACDSKLEEKIIGTWTIDQAIYKLDNTEFFFLSNGIGFKRNNKCSLPIWDKVYDKPAIWSVKIENADTTLILESKNNPIAGIYKLSFRKNPKKKLFQVLLESDEYRFICSKMLYNYDKQKNW